MLPKRLECLGTCRLLEECEPGKTKPKCELNCVFESKALNSSLGHVRLPLFTLPSYTQLPRQKQ